MLARLSRCGFRDRPVAGRRRLLDSAHCPHGPTVTTVTVAHTTACPMQVSISSETRSSAHHDPSAARFAATRPTGGSTAGTLTAGTLTAGFAPAFAAVRTVGVPETAELAHQIAAAATVVCAGARTTGSDDGRRFWSCERGWVKFGLSQQHRIVGYRCGRLIRLVRAGRVCCPHKRQAEQEAEDERSVHGRLLFDRASSVIGGPQAGRTAG